VIARTSLITLIFLTRRRLQDDVEFGLCSSAAATGVAACGAGHHDRAASGGLDAVFVLEDGFQFLCFEQGQTTISSASFFRSAIFRFRM
jgi:hypothetical protein